MFLGGRIVKSGMWVVWNGKRGILVSPYIDVRDPETNAVIKHDYDFVEFHVVRDDRTTESRLTPAAGEFFKTARLAKLKEIPQKSRPAKEHGARLGYL